MMRGHNEPTGRNTHGPITICAQAYKSHADYNRTYSRQPRPATSRPLICVSPLQYSRFKALLRQGFTKTRPDRVGTARQGWLFPILDVQSPALHPLIGTS
eukprot:3308886-Pyramimonas_sp.AAC.2